jgi:hypothetical protein
MPPRSAAVAKSLPGVLAEAQGYRSANTTDNNKKRKIVADDKTPKKKKKKVHFPRSCDESPFF